MLYDTIIIGGGPAGIAAGIYGARKALKILLLTKDFIGQTGQTAWVENYPGFTKISGMELMAKFKEHLKEFPIEICEGDLVKAVKKDGEIFNVETLAGKNFSSRTVLAVPGGQRKTLKVPGEKEFFNKGVSYCAICDAPFFRGKDVAVIGGGNAGFEAARDLLPFARQIYLLEIGQKTLADEATQEQIRQSGRVQVILQAKTLVIKGTKTVESLVYQDLSLGQEKNLAVEGVFIEIGSRASTDFLQGLVDLNEWGEIKIDHRTGSTKTTGLFAAGDATDVKYKQIGVSVGEGIKAMLSAHEYLQKIQN